MDIFWNCTLTSVKRMHNLYQLECPLTVEILEELRTLYQQQKKSERKVKVGDEADELNERIEGEASAARRVLTAISRTTHPVSPPSYSGNSNTSLTHRNDDQRFRIF